MAAEIENGTYTVTRLTCRRREGGPEITNDLMRSIPVETILQAGAFKGE